MECGSRDPETNYACERAEGHAGHHAAFIGGEAAGRLENEIHWVDDAPPPSLSSLQTATKLAQSASRRLDEAGEVDWSAVGGVALAFGLALLERVGPVLLEVAASKAEQKLREW